MPKDLPYSLVAALIIFAIMALTFHQEIGVVGEVAIGWTASPKAFLDTEPMLWTDPVYGTSSGNRWGPFTASHTRPIERFGESGPPLAINQHTGGLSDWPAWLLNAIGVPFNGIRYFYFAAGGALIVLTHRFTKIHGSREAAGLVAIVLAMDWGFVFYKSALGGTEILLQAALLLCLWGIWSRRWGGGRHGLWPISLGVGLGLQAKLTFIIPLISFGIVLTLLRWDKPHMKPPAPRRWVGPFIVSLLLVGPLALTWTHHWSLERSFSSHDFAALQLNRAVETAFGGETPVRERWVNIWYWLCEPLAFFDGAYGSAYSGESKYLRTMGWVLCFIGAGSAWKQRQASKKEALLRFLTPFLSVSFLLTAWLARDMHHFAPLTPLLAIWIALSLEKLAALLTPTRSVKRVAACVLLVLPFLAAGTIDSTESPNVINRIETPTFSDHKQNQLVGILQSLQVRQLTTMDYEVYGMLENRLPKMDIQHAWPMIREQQIKALPGILKAASGGHLISLRASSPMSYNLRPSRKEMRVASAKSGVKATLIGSWSEGAIMVWQITDQD